MTTAGRPPYRRSLLQQERSLNTRRAILRAAVRLLDTQEFSATTVEDICSAAGIGRSTFYLYFESKDQLLMELAEATARGVADDVDSWVGAGTVDDAIGVFIDGLVRRMETASPRLAALVMRRVSAANVTPRPLPGDPILFDDILTDIVREAQHRGEIDPASIPRGRRGARRHDARRAGTVGRRRRHASAARAARVPAQHLPRRRPHPRRPLPIGVGEPRSVGLPWLQSLPGGI